MVSVPDVIHLLSHERMLLLSVGVFYRELCFSFFSPRQVTIKHIFNGDISACLFFLICRLNAQYQISVLQLKNVM